MKQGSMNVYEVATRWLRGGYEVTRISRREWKRNFPATKKGAAPLGGRRRSDMRVGSWELGVGGSNGNGVSACRREEYKRSGGTGGTREVGGAGGTGGAGRDARPGKKRHK